MGSSVKPEWPPGMLPLLTLFFFLAGEAVAFWPPSRDLPVFAQLYAIGLFLMRSELGIQVVMAAGTIAHIIEAAIMAWMCHKRGLKASHTSGWVGIVLLVGYFGFQNFKQLGAKSKRAV